MRSVHVSVYVKVGVRIICRYITESNIMQFWWLNYILICN